MMILDTFKLDSATFQITYNDAYLIWDRAGEIAEQVCKIWPDLKFDDARPEKQTFKGKDVTIITGLNSSIITLTGPNSLSQGNIRLIKDTFEVWSQKLNLLELSRVSTLATYKKKFPTIKDANADLLALKMARWPNEKIFDQPMDADLNSVELFYRFQDEESFSTLRLKTEGTEYVVKLDSSYVDEPEIRRSKNVIVIAFDRGILGSVNAEKFRVDDWIKGFQHVLRRDIEKLTKA